MSNPVVTVVSGTYNRLELLKGMIASARASVPRGFSLDFIIVDGGSTDGTIEWCKTQADVSLIEQGELLGAVNAFTTGANMSQAKYTLLANDDISFHGDSIFRAVMHLEQNPNCGAVAFADNRFDGTYRVMNMSALTEQGQQIFPHYAQVGLFRTWLGNKLQWWQGLPKQEFKSRTYAADNLLTANILEAGYSVDAVDYVSVEDHIANDELRALNMGNPDGEGHKAEYDSAEFYRVFPIEKGPVIRSTPAYPNPDKRALRILYLPIFEPGAYYELQKQTKRGLEDALAEIALVYTYDYVGKFHIERMSRDAIVRELFEIIDTFQPDLMLGQFHQPDIVTTRMLADVRGRNPRMVVVSWNGDAWPHSLTSQEMMDFLRHVDLQLVVNPHIIPKYEGIVPAAYWQIAPESPTLSLPDMPEFDVLYMGNFYARDQSIPPEQSPRALLAKAIKGMDGINVGIFGGDWQKVGIEANGNTLYDFAAGEALMRNAKIVIGENQFQDQRGFVSNRIFQTLAAGAFLLHQTVVDLEEMTGIKDGVHYVAWKTIEEAQEKIIYYLGKPRVRGRIGKAARQFIEEQHTFDVRVRGLFETLLPLARRAVGNTITLRYIGPRNEPFGINVSGIQYEVRPGVPLIMERSHGELVLQKDSQLFQMLESGIG